MLLKERNRCLTMDAFYRQYRGESSSYVDRLQSVQDSMENLQAVIETRVRGTCCVMLYVCDVVAFGVM